MSFWRVFALLVLRDIMRWPGRLLWFVLKAVFFIPMAIRYVMTPIRVQMEEDTSMDFEVVCKQWYARTRERAEKMVRDNEATDKDSLLRASVPNPGERYP